MSDDLHEFEQILSEFIAHKFLDYLYSAKVKTRPIRITLVGTKRERALGGNEINALVREFSNTFSKDLAKPLKHISTDTLANQRAKWLVARLRKEVTK